MERLAKYLPGAKTPIRIAKFLGARPSIERAWAGKFLDGEGAPLVGRVVRPGSSRMDVREVKAEAAPDIGYFPRFG
jgi:hypothetical protein